VNAPKRPNEDLVGEVLGIADVAGAEIPDDGGRVRPVEGVESTRLSRSRPIERDIKTTRRLAHVSLSAERGNGSVGSARKGIVPFCARVRDEIFRR
jgi:hypothetical protein